MLLIPAQLHPWPACCLDVRWELAAPAPLLTHTSPSLPPSLLNNPRIPLPQWMVGFKEAGCAAVVPTYTDGYLYQNGWGLTSKDYITFVRWMAATARSLGLGFGLRDSAELVSASTVDVWDFAWDVGCFTRSPTACAAYLPFTQGGCRSRPWLSWGAHMSTLYACAQCRGGGLGFLTVLSCVLRCDLPSVPLLTTRIATFCSPPPTLCVHSQQAPVPDGGAQQLHGSRRCRKTGCLEGAGVCQTTGAQHAHHPAPRRRHGATLLRLQQQQQQWQHWSSVLMLPVCRR